jgi:hypothetical protein
MPRVIETADKDAIELGELVEGLETSAFDPEDEESLAHFGPALRRLSNNRRFLGDLVIDELKQQCAAQLRLNQYSPQVIMLHGTSRKFLVRANFWPAAEDSVVVNSGTDPFFYGVPHDHNFSFVTVGHIGPGYWSDYYEYDYERTIGYVGEKVDLRFVERTRLAEGKVLLYRRHRDVHDQLPPDSLSVSLNILAITPGSSFRDQYLFDVEQSRIKGHVNRNSLEALLLIAGHIGGENGRDLVHDFAARHPSERIRFAAIKARASNAPDPESRAALLDQAAADASGAFVREMAKREAGRIRAALPFYARGATAAIPPLP